MSSQRLETLDSSRLGRILPEDLAGGGRLRWLTVAGVLLAGVLISLLLGLRQLELAAVAALLPIVVLFLLLLLDRPQVYPVILLATAAYIPFAIDTGTHSRIVMSLVVAVAFTGLWILRMVSQKRLALVPSPVNAPLLIFMAVVLIALVWSMAFRDPRVVTWDTFTIVQVASALVMIMLPASLLLVVNHANSLKLLKWMVAVMLVAGAIGTVKQYSIQNGLPAQDLFVNVRGLFSLWIIALSMGLVLFNRQLAVPVRLLLLVLAGAWVYLGFVLKIGWLAGWLPGFMALGVLAFMRSWKLAVLLAVLLLVVIAVNSDYYIGHVLEAEQAESGRSRLVAWQDNWSLTRRHLLFGTGPAGYEAYYRSFWPQPANATHNSYLDILAQTGIFGLAAIFWFFGVVLWRGYRMCLRLRGRRDFTEALANATFAGAVAVFIQSALGDWLIPFAYTQTIGGFNYNVYNWIFLGTILVLDRLTAAPEEPRHA